MALPDLTDQFISDIYGSWLQTANQPLTGGTLRTVYDGRGNTSSLQVSNTALKVNGSLSAQSLYLTDPSFVVNLIYPVGAVYFSTSAANPSLIFAGTTWIRQGEGKFLVGVGSGSDGTNTKTFTVGDNVGSYQSSSVADHFHDIGYIADPPYDDAMFIAQNRTTGGDGQTYTGRGVWGENNNSFPTPISMQSSGITVEVLTTGSKAMGATSTSSTDPVTPPAYALYIWVRTA